MVDMAGASLTPQRPIAAASGAPNHLPTLASRRHARRARVVIILLLLAVAWACFPFLAGLMGAVILAVVTMPPYRRVARTMGARRAALLVTIACAVLLVAPSVLLIAGMVRQFPDALQRVVQSDGFARLSALRIGPVDIGAQIVDIGQHAVTWGSSRAVAAAGSVTRMVINLLLALVGLYYLLPNGPALWRAARPFIPFSADGSKRLGERFTSITEASVLAILVTALSQGFIVGFAFRLVALPNPLFWGAMTGLVSILPILGSSLIWFPAAAVLLLDGRIGAGITMALIGGLISSNVDNVLRPLIYRRVSGLHPMVSLVGAFAGMQLLGFVGVLLGPLALAYCLELLELYRTEYGSLV